jgi:hypothetical protein
MIHGSHPTPLTYSVEEMMGWLRDRHRPFLYRLGDRVMIRLEKEPTPPACGRIVMRHRVVNLHASKLHVLNMYRVGDTVGDSWGLWQEDYLAPSGSTELAQPHREPDLEEDVGATEFVDAGRAYMTVGYSQWDDPANAFRQYRMPGVVPMPNQSSLVKSITV